MRMGLNPEWNPYKKAMGKHKDIETQKLREKTI